MRKKTERIIKWSLMIFSIILVGYSIFKLFEKLGVLR